MVQCSYAYIYVCLLAPVRVNGDINGENLSRRVNGDGDRKHSPSRSPRGPVKLACDYVFVYKLTTKINNYLVKRPLIVQMCSF